MKIWLVGERISTYGLLIDGADVDGGDGEVSLDNTTAASPLLPCGLQVETLACQVSSGATTTSFCSPPIHLRPLLQLDVSSDDLIKLGSALSGYCPATSTIR